VTSSLAIWHQTAPEWVEHWGLNFCKKYSAVKGLNGLLHCIIHVFHHTCFPSWVVFPPTFWTILVAQNLWSCLDLHHIPLLHWLTSVADIQHPGWEGPGGADCMTCYWFPARISGNTGVWSAKCCHLIWNHTHLTKTISRSRTVSVVNNSSLSLFTYFDYDVFLWPCHDCFRHHVTTSFQFLCCVLRYVILCLWPDHPASCSNASVRFVLIPFVFVLLCDSYFLHAVCRIFHFMHDSSTGLALPFKRSIISR
jgi:hypothetical protein